MGLGECTSDLLGISLTVAGPYTKTLQPIAMNPYGGPQEMRNQHFKQHNPAILNPKPLNPQT